MCVDDNIAGGLLSLCCVCCAALQLLCSYCVVGAEVFSLCNCPGLV